MVNLGDCLHPQFIIFHFPFSIFHLSLNGGKPTEIRRIRVNPRPMLSIGSTKLAAERMQAYQQVSRPFRMAQDEGKGAFIEGQVKAWSDPAPSANDRSDRPEQFLARDRRVNPRKRVAARDQELLAREPLDPARSCDDRAGDSRVARLGAPLAHEPPPEALKVGIHDQESNRHAA